MTTFNIFYSWQLDTDPKRNKYFINDCLNKAIKEIKKDNTINVIPRLDKDTEDRTGSPDIVDSIFKKIDACNIFVADITLINSGLINEWLKNKPTPNPNVLIELGYAVNRLSWDRIICLNNSDISDLNKMPFDLRKNRISQYRCGSPRNKEQSENTVNLLKKAIKNIIVNYDTIISKELHGNYSYHDKRIFENFSSIITENEFKDFFEQIATISIIEKPEFQLIRNMCDFLDSTGNQFLIKEIDEMAKNLLESLRLTSSTLSQYSGSEYEEYVDEETKEIVQRFYYKLNPDRNYYPSYEKYAEEKYRRGIEIGKSIDKAIQAYTDFRKEIKKHLFI